LQFESAEAVIAAFATALQALSSEVLVADLANYEYPLCWNHYNVLFGAGLELFDPDVARVMDNSKRRDLLQQCCELLAALEGRIGSRSWNLSSCLRGLMENDASSNKSQPSIP
jgi:hypothetical protein